MDAWVLWHMYGDGSAAHIERVYLDKERAEEDHSLLSNLPCSGSEWKLAAVPIYGQINNK
mgnify:CR=1 FL=1